MQHWTTTKGLENARNPGGFKRTVHYCWALRDWFHSSTGEKGRQSLRSALGSGLIRERHHGQTISWRAALVFFLCISIKLSPLDCFWIMHNNRWEQRLPGELQPMAAQRAHPVPQLPQALWGNQSNTQPGKAQTVQKCICHKNKEYLTGHLALKQNSQTTFCSQVSQLKPRQLQNLY